MKLKKIVVKLHLWLGLISGLVVFILGITGSIYAFEEEIKDWIYADKLWVDISREEPQTSSLSSITDIAQTEMGDGFPIQYIRLKSDSRSSYVFYHSISNAEPSDIWYWDEVERYLAVYVNPYTSEVLKKEDLTFEFFNVIVWLHWSLLLKNEVGQPIVGAATLIFVIMLITGLILWWPNNKKALKVRTWFRWKSTAKWRRKNYDLHNIVGFYSMFLVIFVALTGLMWAFSWFDNGVQWIANGGQTIKKEEFEVVSTSISLTSSHPLDIVHHSLKWNHPKAKTFYINLPQDSTGTIGTYADYKDNTKDVYIQFDQYSGELLHTGGKWEDKTNGAKVWAYNYDIHTGAIGGLVGKTIAFFLSLFSASLPVTGFLIWWGRNRKKRKLVRTGGNGGAKKFAEGEEDKKLVGDPLSVLKNQSSRSS